MAKPGLCDRPLFSFPGTEFTEASQFVKGGGTAVGGRGFTKSRTSCGRIRGRVFVQAPEGSSIELPCVLCPTPPKRCHQTPTATVSKLPPQESEGVEPEFSTPVAKGSGLAQEAPSLTVSQALKVAIPTYMRPLHLNVRASKGYINARLRGVVRDHQPPRLPYTHLCALTIWG